MPKHLSKRADKVIKTAHTIAKDYEQEYVGTEHILLAIADDGTGIGAQVLIEQGATEAKIQSEVDKLMAKSMEDTWVFGRLPGSPHFRNVVARAIEEAEDLGNPEVCTEHLLLGLLREKGSVAYEALKSLGLNAKLVRDKVRQAQAQAKA